MSRAEPKDCMSTYGNGLEEGTFNLLAVTKNGSNPKQSDTFSPPYNTTLPVLAYFHPLEYPQKVQDWCSKYYEIDYCLTTTAEHECQLKYSSMILYIAIVCNVVKLASILACLLMSREPIFATIGDAMDSFLRRPDQASRGRCLMSKLDDRIFPDNDETGQYIPLDSYPPQPWVEGNLWLGRHGTLRRWTACIFLWLASVVVGIVFMVKGINLVGLKKAFSMGFGALSLNAIAAASGYEGGSSKSILTTSLIANIPQLLLSGLYFMYNAVLTSMAATHEWSMFAHKRITLRVTLPVGAQRETYWLGLPWRYSLPFLICSTVFHWLISQSIFLINITIYQPNTEVLTKPTDNFPGVRNTGMITACGYSPLAIACALGVALILLFALLVLSSRKLKPGMPLVGSCSLGISAACHPPILDESAAIKPLLWGAVAHEKNGKPGHCCLTSFEVERPREGVYMPATNDEIFTLYVKTPKIGLLLLIFIHGLPFWLVCRDTQIVSIYNSLLLDFSSRRKWSTYACSTCGSCKL
ncbi:hypothetical protein N7495_007436 [Penicillium taxi]|uniref:uncharacterized protein n=1 Tax=Penicillium taxi TaxID=168475 RepID=UPI002545258D|nr:uncharacterized protein N7495_007436 [Penicillium taxi]KAJ5887395.1 hypothetical protein N7495_007436 [Penicillium taxi]